MLTCMIADDEMWVCQLIRSAVNWEALGFEVLCETYNGIDTLEKIKELRPHVVVTDIRMPGLDGLEIVHETLREGLQCRFIIISGHQDFEYAQKAIKLGVSDYILKPLDESELENALRRIGADVSSEEHRDKERADIIDKLTESQRELKEKYFTNVISERVLDADIQQEFEKFGLNRVWKVISVIKADALCREVLPPLDKLAQKAIGIDACVHALERKSQVVLFLDVRPEQLLDVVEPILAHAVQYCAQFGNYKITVGVSTFFQSISYTYYAYLEAKEALRARIFSKENRIICFQDVHARTPAKSMLRTEAKKTVERILEARNAEEMRTYLLQIFGLFRESEELNTQKVRQLCIDLIQVMHNIFGEGMVDTDEVPLDQEQLLDALDDCPDLERIFDRLEEIFSATLLHSNSSLLKKRNVQIELAKKYISENYSKRILLSDVANELYLNATYLSDLFKRETGVTFSDFLATFRVDIARELLHDVRYRISEVAVMSGYANARQFSKVFKKHVGITPADYRKVHI